ncbi:MAG: YiiD C-terminal domain-containing protein [Deltaproteobacteria bacterium]
MSDGLDAYTRYLRDNIPLTGAMEVSVTYYDGKKAVLQAPFAPNINHRHTIFGGSIAILGIMAGWFVLHERIAAEKVAARLVIQKSEVDYLLAGNSAFEAECCLEEDDFSTFLKVLERKRKSRLQLCSIIRCDQRFIARHQGLYVGLRH